jgi:O-antigen ligase
MNVEKIKNFSPAFLGIYSFAFFAPLSIAFSQISIGITVIGWIFLIMSRKALNWKRTALDIPLLIYAGIQLIAALNSQDILTGLKNWLNTDWFIIFFYAVIHVLHEEDQYKKVILLLAVSGTIAAAYGIIQHFIGIDYIRGNTNIWPYGKFHRAIGFFDIPLTYGGVQLCLFFLILPFYFLKSPLFNRKIVLIILFFLCLSIFASYARSAWLGLGGAMLLMLVFLENKYKISILLTLLAVLLALYLFHPQLLFENGIISMFDVSETAPYNNLVRLNLWHSSINLIRDNWLIGVGYSHFYDIFSIYKVPFDYGGLSDPHNIYLKVICHSGIIGGLAFIYVWFQFLYANYRIYKPDFVNVRSIFQAGSIGSFFAIFSLLIAGITQEYYYDHENAELWWFIAALGCCAILNQKKTNLKP